MHKHKVTTSWDDGHVLDIRVAKLLKKYGVKGTFYVSPLDREFKSEDRLTNYDIKKISQNFEIGAHTMTHPKLAEISKKEAKKEINESKKYLEKLIGRKITSFCYPYGDYNSSVSSLVKKSNFKTARTIVRFKTSVGSNKFTLPTTVHAYTHKKDVLNLSLVFKYKTIDWEVIAKKEFDEFLLKGGVYHLWGHSWEIDKFGGWKKLERVLMYISNKKDVLYVENKNL